MCLWCCHSKRRIGAQGPANPSFSMTLTIDFYCVPFTDYIVESVLYQRRIGGAPQPGIVDAIPKEGLVRPRLPILLFVPMTKI